MFREGVCPRCQEKIQVPDDRERIICMFCGQEIAVAEALGETEEKKKELKVGSAEYEEAIRTARAELEKVIRECGNPLSEFKRERYEGAFAEFYAARRELFEALEISYAAASEQEQWLEEMSACLVGAAAKALEDIRFKGNRNRKQMDLNFLISIYLVPSMLKYPGTFSEPFADHLIAAWNREFSMNIGKARYEEITSGFRKKLCYITTAVCESLGKGPDCYELTVLKEFRDGPLSLSEGGPELIEEYYDIAPTIVKRMEREPDRDSRYRELYEDWLEPCIREIEREDYEACMERYRQMVLNLKDRYIS